MPCPRRSSACTRGEPWVPNEGWCTAWDLLGQQGAAQRPDRHWTRAPVVAAGLGDPNAVGRRDAMALCHVAGSWPGTVPERAEDGVAVAGTEPLGFGDTAAQSLDAGTKGSPRGVGVMLSAGSAQALALGLLADRCRRPGVSSSVREQAGATDAAAAPGRDARPPRPLLKGFGTAPAVAGDGPRGGARAGCHPGGRWARTRCV